MWRMGGAESTEHERRKVGGGGGGGAVVRSLQCQRTILQDLQICVTSCFPRRVIVIE